MRNSSSLALRVTVPVASFRHPDRRLSLTTYNFPPPTTCYGFLLSLVGEEDPRRHIGVRLTPALLSLPQKSRQLFTFHRLKNSNRNHKDNKVPDYREILTDLDAVIFVDSSDEVGESPTLVDRALHAVEKPHEVKRWGPLYLGSSNDLVDNYGIFDVEKWSGVDEVHTLTKFKPGNPGLKERVAVWPDYQSLHRARWNQASLVASTTLVHPKREEMFEIGPR